MNKDLTNKEELSDMMESEFKELREELFALIQDSKVIEKDEITKIQPLAGDASLKKFYRIITNNSKFQSLILLKLTNSSGPLVTGSKITQDEGFAVIGDFLSSNQVPIPKRYWIKSDNSICLEEDLGDKLLAMYLSPNFSGEVQLSQFNKALYLIPTLQNLKVRELNIVFNRSISESDYFQESCRFLEFFPGAKELSSAKTDIFEKCIKRICNNITKHPQTTIFRDLMAWNIMIDSNAQLRLVDYQDMCQGSYAYDLVTLLHDRDTDLSLGDTILYKLFNNYCDLQRVDKEEFLNHYFECLLQRFLRLSGQFYNIAARTKKDKYLTWVPGCMYRIGRALASPQSNIKKDYEILSDALNEVSEDFRRGYEDPYLFLD